MPEKLDIDRLMRGSSVYEQKVLAKLAEIERLFKEGNYADALLACDELLKYDSGLAVAWYNKGIILKKLALRGIASFRDALKCLDKAAVLEEKEANFWASKADLLLIMKKYESALHAIVQALKLNSEDWRYWYLKAEILSASHKPGAYHDLKKAEELKRKQRNK